MQKQLPGVGKSSFDLIDPQKLFESLTIARGSIFADLGCGRGEYALHAANLVGEGGTVYAVDLWQEGLAALKSEAERRGLANLSVLAADICATLPIESQSVDLCFIATVLHDLVREGCADGTLREARRILKAQGSLAIVEFKKFEGHPGPSIEVKLSPDQVEQIVGLQGFAKEKITEIGSYNYLIVLHPRPVGKQHSKSNVPC